MYTLPDGILSARLMFSFQLNFIQVLAHDNFYMDRQIVLAYGMGAFGNLWECPHRLNVKRQFFKCQWLLSYSKDINQLHTYLKPNNIWLLLVLVKLKLTFPSPYDKSILGLPSSCCRLLNYVGLCRTKLVFPNHCIFLPAMAVLYAYYLRTLMQDVYFLSSFKKIPIFFWTQSETEKDLSDWIL